MTRVARRSCRAGGARLERVVQSTCSGAVRTLDLRHVTARLSATNVLARCAVLRRDRRLRAVRTSSGPGRPNVAPQPEFALGFQSLHLEPSRWWVHRHHPSLSWIGSETASRPSFVGGRVVPADLASVIRLRHRRLPDTRLVQRRCRDRLIERTGADDRRPDAQQPARTRRMSVPCAKKQNGPGRQLRAVR